MHLSGKEQQQRFRQSKTVSERESAICIGTCCKLMRVADRIPELGLTITERSFIIGSRDQLQTVFRQLAHSRIGFFTGIGSNEPDGYLIKSRR